MRVGSNGELMIKLRGEEVTENSRPRILVVSSIPFSPSNRGIDIITQALVGLDAELTHLAFASKWYLRHNVDSQAKEYGINQQYLFYSSFGYVERIMRNWGSSITKWVIEHSVRNLSFDFTSYNLIIIESGKPVFLLPLLPDNSYVVYRRSDPMSIAYKNPEVLACEDRIMRRANQILEVRDFERLGLCPDYARKKSTIVTHGYDLLESDEDISASVISREDEGCMNAVYVGFIPLDVQLLVRLAEEIPNLKLHIVGDCLSRMEKMHIAKYKNIILYGNIPSCEYLPIVKSCDIAIMPFKKTEQLDYLGLNSKFLMSMASGLPIVSRELGFQDEFPDSEDIFFSNDDEAFCRAVKRKLSSLHGPVEYPIDLDCLSKSRKTIEYQEYFKKVFSKMSAF